MRYLLSVIANRNGDVMASREEMDAIDAFNETISGAGQRLLAIGIEGPDRALTIDNRDGGQRVTRAPAVDSELFMAGMWVIDVENDEVAHSLAIEASKACNRLIEVRRIFD